MHRAGPQENPLKERANRLTKPAGGLSRRYRVGEHHPLGDTADLQLRDGEERRGGRVARDSPAGGIQQSRGMFAEA